MGSGKAPPILLLALVLTLTAIALDQFAAPILYTTSPLSAAAACLLLVWRRGKTSLSSGDAQLSISLSKGRLIAFLSAHVVLVLTFRFLAGALQAVSGTLTAEGTLLAALKLCVLVPTLLLLPPAAWTRIAREYSSEFVASLVVLTTFFPRRVFAAMWPWYGQVLGKFVFHLSALLVPSLGYVKAKSPTLTGSQLDVTIIPACSGINGLELFDFLFALLAICDWNRLRKPRALLVYFGGLLAMLLGNALRIASLVVLGNHGFAEVVASFHISAGWIFFSVVFLAFLALTYGWMIRKEDRPAEFQQTI